MFLCTRKISNKKYFQPKVTTVIHNLSCRYRYDSQAKILNRLQPIKKRRKLLARI